MNYRLFFSSLIRLSAFSKPFLVLKFFFLVLAFLFFPIGSFNSAADFIVCSFAGSSGERSKDSGKTSVSDSGKTSGGDSGKTGGSDSGGSTGGIDSDSHADGGDSGGKTGGSDSGGSTGGTDSGGHSDSGDSAKDGGTDFGNHSGDNGSTDSTGGNDSGGDTGGDHGGNSGGTDSGGSAGGTDSSGHTGGGDTGGSQDNKGQAGTAIVLDGGVTQTLPDPGQPGGVGGPADPRTGVAIISEITPPTVPKVFKDVEIVARDGNGNPMPDAPIYVDKNFMGIGRVVISGDASEKKAYRVNFGYVDGFSFCPGCNGPNSVVNAGMAAVKTQGLMKSSAASGSEDVIQSQQGDIIFQMTPGPDAQSVQGVYTKENVSKKTHGTVRVTPVTSSGAPIRDVPVIIDGLFQSTGPISSKMRADNIHKVQFGVIDGYVLADSALVNKKKDKPRKALQLFEKKLTTYDVSVNPGETKTVFVEFKEVEPDTTAPRTSASLDSGIYDYPMAVALECSDNGKYPTGCDFTYYTLDGERPTTKSKLYTSSIAIFQTTTLKFFSVDAAENREKVKTRKYTILQ